MVEALRLIGSVLIVVSFVLALAGVVAHLLLARWWETAHGRHVFAFQTVLALSLGLWSLRLLIPDGDWFQTVRLIAFAGIPVVLAWRLQIIIQTWRDMRRKSVEEDP